MVSFYNDNPISQHPKSANKSPIADTSAIDWSRINLFCHGNYFAATYYTSTTGTQRHILAVIASKLDVTVANPFDEEHGADRFITQEDLLFMTAVSKSTLNDALAVLSGEVPKPIPSTDDDLWLDAKGNRIAKPNENQRSLFEQWQKSSYKIYIVRNRRKDPKTGLNDVTTYGVTSQLIEDYKHAILTGKVRINQDINRKYLITLYSDNRSTVVRPSEYGSPTIGVRQSDHRSTESPEPVEQSARQGAFLTVDNSVDKEVDNNKPRTKIEPLERKRSGAVSSGDSSISKTALLGAISGVLKPTEKAEVSTLIRDTLIDKGFSRGTIVKACEWIFQMAGMKRISHDPGKIHLWIEACQSIDAGDFYGKESGQSLNSSEDQASFEAFTLDIEQKRAAAEEAKRQAVLEEKAAREQAILALDFQTVVSSCFETRKLRPLQKKKLSESACVKDLMGLAREDAEFKAIFEAVVNEYLAASAGLCCQAAS
jgi:hypothetical protein